MMFSLLVGRTTTLRNRPLEHMNMKDPLFVIFLRKTFDFNPNESNNFFTTSHAFEVFDSASLVHRRNESGNYQKM